MLQELFHAYLPVARFATLDSALILAKARIPLTFPIESEDVERARALVDAFPKLGARDLFHLACCERRRVDQIKTFDHALEGAFRKLTHRG